jgi:hypothetical protein
VEVRDFRQWEEVEECPGVPVEMATARGGQQRTMKDTGRMLSTASRHLSLSKKIGLEKIKEL